MKSMYLLYTGGTFGMVSTDPSGLLWPQPLATVCRYIPDWNVDWFASPRSVATGTGDICELGQVSTSIQGQQVEIRLASTDKPIDSSCIDVDHWHSFARLVVDKHDTFDGFVIIHGTDTMAYSASALAFSCANTTKPVVFTGAQRPIDHTDSDALCNLDDALVTASQGAIHEVVICFAGSVIRGCRAHKSSTRFDRAFVSVNYPELAGFRPFRIHTEAMHPVSSVHNCHFEALSASVSLCWLHPGMDIADYCQQLRSSSAQAFVLCSFGDGHIPKNRQLIETCADLKKQGKPVVNLSQCEHHPETGDRYLMSVSNSEAGLIDGGDATIEATCIKLMWALAKYQSIERVEEVMCANVRGERTGGDIE